MRRIALFVGSESILGRPGRCGGVVARHLSERENTVETVKRGISSAFAILVSVSPIVLQPKI
jgi:hypothetical protein